MSKTTKPRARKEKIKIIDNPLRTPYETKLPKGYNPSRATLADAIKFQADNPGMFAAIGHIAIQQHLANRLVELADEAVERGNAIKKKANPKTTVATSGYGYLAAFGERIITDEGEDIAMERKMQLQEKAASLLRSIDEHKAKDEGPTPNIPPQGYATLADKMRIRVECMAELVTELIRRK